MIHVRRSIAALLCVMFCLSFVGVGTAMADDSGTPEPTENQETVPAANEEAAPSEEPAAPAGEAAPVEQSNTAEAEVTENEADPAQGEEVKAPDTTEPQTDAPAEEETEPQGDEQPAPEANDIPEADSTEPEADTVEGEAQTVSTEPEQEVKEAEEKSVTLDAGYGQFEEGEKTKEVKLEDDKLPDLEGYKPTLDGWTFKGWYDQPPVYFDFNYGECVKAEPRGNEYDKDDDPPAGGVLYAYYEFTNDYAEPEPAPRTVTLDAGEGWFGKYGTDSATKTQTVTLDDEDKIPELDSHTPTFSDSGEDEENSRGFAGWWTKKPTVTKESNGDGTWHYKVTKNGEQITADKPVPDGVNTLYAVYQYDESTTLITYYYDWNGINGMYGECLTSTRKADNGQYPLTLKDLAIFNFNYSSGNEDLDSKIEDGTGLEDLKAYWGNHPVYGTTDTYFDGWTLNNVDVGVGTQVKEGDHLKAKWHKGNQPAGSGSEAFTPPPPVEATEMAFDGTSFTSIHTHANSTATVSVSFFARDGGGTTKAATPNTIKWTVKVYLTNDDGTHDQEYYKKLFSGEDTSTETITVSCNPNNGVTQSETGKKATGVTVTATGKTLSVTSDSDSIVYICASSNKMETPVSARVTFAHNWVADGKAEMPSCTSTGKATFKCSGCDETKTVTYDEEGHRYTYMTEVCAASATTKGQMSRKCIVCGHVDTVETPSGNELRGRTPSSVVAEYSKIAGINQVFVNNSTGKDMTNKSDPVGTGWEIVLVNTSNLVDVIDVMVTGDTNGDGYVTAADADDVLQDVVAPGTLTGVYEQAAHVTGGGSVSTNDAVALLDMAG